MIYLLIIIQSVFATPCLNNSKDTTHQLLCQTEGKKSLLQMIEVKGGCEFPEGNKKDCIVFKECGSSSKEGRTFILKGTNLNDYCLLKDNLFSANKNTLSSVYSYCENDKFMGFNLRHKGDKNPKLCKLNWVSDEQPKN